MGGRQRQLPHRHRGGGSAAIKNMSITRAYVTNTTTVLVLEPTWGVVRCAMSGMGWVAQRRMGWVARAWAGPPAHGLGRRRMGWVAGAWAGSPAHGLGRRMGCVRGRMGCAAQGRMGCVGGALAALRTGRGRMGCVARGFARTLWYLFKKPMSHGQATFGCVLVLAVRGGGWCWLLLQSRA